MERDRKREKSVPLFSQYDIETVNVRFEFAYRK